MRTIFKSPIERYDRYREHCEHVIQVRPMSFELWQRMEPWLLERGRIAILDELRFHCKPRRHSRCKRGPRLRGNVSVANYEARLEAAALVTIGA